MCTITGNFYLTALPINTDLQLKFCVFPVKCVYLFEMKRKENIQNPTTSALYCGTIRSSAKCWIYRFSTVQGTSFWFRKFKKKRKNVNK